MAQPARLPTPRRLVLYDGVCVFCHRAVRRLLEIDREQRLRFAPLQGETAAALRRRHPEIPQGIDTLVYVECDGDTERVSLRSEAAFRLAAQLDSGWRRLTWLRPLPRALTDLAYRLFARLRYRIFGKLDACPLPSAEERSRFLP